MRLNKIIFPWVSTLPILVIFLFIIFFLGENIPLSDGIRYWQTAEDIIHGFKGKSIKESFLLLNGPLYPIILSLFKIIGFSVKGCIYLNALFLYVGFTLFLKALLNFFNKNLSLLITYTLLLIDPFLFYWAAKLYSEPLSIMFVGIILFYSYKVFKKQNKIDLLILSFSIAFLILTRVLFAYVFSSLTILFLVLSLFKGQKFNNLSFKICSLAMLICIPYLIFTYSVTKKVFFWASNGGDVLYWTSSPYMSDLGEWHTFPIIHEHFASRYKNFSGLDSIYLHEINEIIISKINNNHYETSKLIENKNRIEKDEILKSLAIKNIRNHPFSFIKNWILNSSRLIFGFPHAIYFKPPYSPLFSVFNTIKSSIIFVLFFLSILFSFLNKFKIYPILIFFLLIIMFYLGGQSMLAVQSQRALLPIYPIIIFFISVVFKSHTKIISLEK